MKRTFVYLSALVGFGGMIALAGATRAQPPGAPGTPPAAAATPQGRATIAVFNMAAVMRDYGKAKYQVYVLNQKRLEMSKDLLAWRGQYIKTQQLIPATTDPVAKDRMSKELLDLQRKIEDKDRDINKVLNEDASAIISKLYDEIKMVVDKTAEMNGYHVVFAYPDAVTDEEKNNPYLKELKLKPPAAQPFFVSKQVDITPVVTTTLNTWYPAVDAAGKPVDVSKLPALEQPGAAAPGTAPAGGPAPVGGVVPGTPGRP